MSCGQAKALIEARLDGESVDACALDGHLAECGACRGREEQARQLQARLRALPVDGPRSGFFDRALVRATASAQRAPRRGWAMPAAAAGLVVGLAFGVLLGSPLWDVTGSKHGAQRVELVAGNGVQPVKLVFDAPRDLSGVEMTLRVDGAVAIDGYAGERSLRWQTDLDAGKNLLTLPVLPSDIGSGEVVATLNHAGLKRTFHVRVDVRPRQPDDASVLPRDSAPDSEGEDRV